MMQFHLQMEIAMDLREAFGTALVKSRKSAGLTQEDFETVSSRSYISYIERGKNSITLEKLDSLSKVIGIHPVSVIFQTYLEYENQITPMELMRRIMDDLSKLSDIS